ncbi:MAG: hypothetical protein J5940_04105 [Clostridia bacterium]|nr:hypothetical protein [Clostridia bacterium]
MDNYRSRFTDELLVAKERALYKSMTEVCDRLLPEFDELGYELDIRFRRVNEITDYQDELIDNEPTLANGYVSYLSVQVLRKNGAVVDGKSDVDPADLEVNDLADDDEEANSLDLAIREDEPITAEQAAADERLEESARISARAVAFTRVMLLRLYKVFWRERVDFSDGTEQLEADLREFLEKLKAM